ncbi:hypothetical protein JKF63_04858 [Porcisia hertigi]|uniref:Cation/H+ exchanger transmembrane domain-containing protein n=1 Tax=Porcisia hertigi TaxID=2761500 RepID=A0A836IFK9_9TRYP|nr:hypothetical protein JKF63_04858 [Porcisia hertigi]
MARTATPLEGSADSPNTNDPGCRSLKSFEELSVRILFVTMLIFLGGTFFMTHRRRIPLPYTVVLFLYGIVVGVVARWLFPGVSEALGDMPPELLFYIFLPVLIFEGSYAINIHALRRIFPQILLLATVGVLINTALLALPVKGCFQAWSWYAALLLGSLLSATDPVAVVALLKELGVDKSMTAMVDGEAVMNDGTAIILFSLLLPAARVGFVEKSAGMIVLQCISLALLPIVLGPLFGFVQSFWLRRTGDGLTKACITVSVTYVSYYISAELVGTSGVLTLFFQGIFLSYYCPSLFPGREGNIISSTWEFLVHLSNTVLFSLVGVILVADVLPTLKLSDIFVVIALYIAMMLSRLLMLEILSPVLNIFSYKFDQKRIALMVHAGLRGGVAATLALAVKQEGLKEGVDILKITSGIVLLTLLVNATTSARVVERLGFKSKPEYRIATMEYAMELMRSSQEHALEGVKRDPKYRNASWMHVEGFVRAHIQSPFRDAGVVLEEDEDKTVNRMLMSVFKAALWRQRDNELITETVVMQLGAVIATLIDKGELLNVEQMYWYHRHRGTRSNEPEQPIETQSSQRRARLHSSFVLSRRSRESTRQRQPLSASQCLSKRSATDVTIDGAAALLPERSEEMQKRSSRAPSLAGVVESTNVVVRGGGTGFQDSDSTGDDESRTGADENHNRDSSMHDGMSPRPGDSSGAVYGAVSGAEKAQTDRMVADLMRRLLPPWVVLVERFICSPGYFAATHRRAQENAFVVLLAVVKCLTAISPLKFKFTRSEAQAQRVVRWMTTQITAANRAIRFFYANFPEATNNVASSRAVVSVANALEETTQKLHSEHVLGTRATEMLEEMVMHMRSHTPLTWENNASQKASNLVLRAVAATTLGKGLRKAEINAISSMGLIRNFREGDIITLPDNAFLVVVFGSLCAVYGQWTTLNEHDQIESFGDTIGLEALMLPQEFRVDQQRRWRVISTDSTALIISFNSIKPFLTERSLRAVKALWRAAAVEVLLPIFSRMVTVQDSEARSKREHLVELIMAGTPLIGPHACDLASCETSLHLYFYLRGSDVSGLFNSHTPPCYISIFFVSQLRWVDADAVLYAIPTRVGDGGYVPWTTTARAAVAAPTSPAASEEDDRVGEEGSVEGLEGVVSVGGGSSAVAPSVSLPLSALGSSYELAVNGPALTPARCSSTWGGHVQQNRDISAHGFSGAHPVGSPVADRNENSTADAFFMGGVMGHTGVPSQALFGEGNVATHAGATNIINNVLLGCLPEDLDDPWLNTSNSAVADPLDLTVCPTVSQPSFDVFPNMPALSERLSRAAALHDMTDAEISIFYTLDRFVTPIPFVNQMFVRYASSLEQLCIATLRYLRFPADPFHVRHAQTTCEQTVEFLLSFCVVLSMLNQAYRTVSEYHHEGTGVLNALHTNSDIDSAFQARICAWVRRHRLNGKFDLKAMVTEMNKYANQRFPEYVAVLRQMVELEPGLRDVETAEGMNSLCHQIVKSRQDAHKGG